MSAEEFELLSSQDANAVNDEQKDTTNSPNTEETNPELIASDAQLVHSEPVSLAASTQSQQDPNRNHHIQEAIESHLISEINPSSNDENESHHDNDSDESDMNMEQTPPTTLSQNEPIFVNHESNHNQSHYYNSEQEDHEAKDEEEDQEGMNPPNEGIQNDDAPIASTIETTPNHHQKIYDNPYLNGSKSTPGAPDGEDGEESDAIDDDEEDDDDDMDAMVPPHFTLNDDGESDEEKDDVISDHNKAKNANMDHKDEAQNVDNNKRNVHVSLVVIISIVFGFIAYYIGYYRTTATLHKPDAPKLHCPSSVIYVPLDGNAFYIDASHTDHPSATHYEWDILHLQSHSDLFVDGENTHNLLLMFDGDNTVSTRTVDIDLYISSHINHYVFNKQCSVSVLFHEIPYFGIDLGTTYSCIAYQHQAQTRIIVADKDRAEHCIPTAVYYAMDGSVIIGEDALKKLASDPTNVIYDIKRIVGHDCHSSEMMHFNNTHSFTLHCNANTVMIFVPNLNGYIHSEQALSVILGHLVDIASFEFGVPYLSVADIVVSVPALFHNGQRCAIRSATELVGLNVAQLVVEPTAAALAYSYYSSTPSDNFKLFLTFDFGGGTLDCSVLRCTGVDCEVIGVKGNSSLGGIDFDHVIADIMMHKYEELHGWHNVYTSDKLKAKFVKVAERVKKSLSVSSQHQVIMTNDELLNTEKKQIVITRKEFETHPKTVELIDSAIQTAKDAIHNERIKASNIRMILMIGGTTKIPIIQRRLKQVFGTGDDRLKLVFPDDDPQLMVVKGSAIIGASLAIHNAHKQIVLEDVIPLSLGFSICLTNYNDSGETKCGIMDVIIDKNSHYPTKANVVYCQKDPSSSIAKLDLYQGDDAFVANNYLLSHLSISGIPKRDANVCDSIIVEFIIDKNGIANIEATINDENKTSFSKKLSVVSNDANLSKQDIKRLKTKMIPWFKGREQIQTALGKQ